MWITKHKSFSMAIGIGLASLLLVYLAVVPIYSNASGMLRTIDTKSKELESLTTKVSILSKLDPNVLSERVRVLDQALPPKKDVLLYLNSIDGLSRELGLVFGGLTLTPGEVTEATGSAAVAKQPVKTTGVQSLETQIKMSGSQDSLYTFLRTIEGVLPLMQIKDVKVTILGNDQFSLALTLSMLWAEPVTADIRGPVTLFGVEEDRYFTQLSEYRRFDTKLAIPPSDTGGKKQDLFAPFNSALPTDLGPLPTPTPKPQGETAGILEVSEPSATELQSAEQQTQSEPTPTPVDSETTQPTQ
jgi:hypothetical protein